MTAETPENPSEPGKGKRGRPSLYTPELAAEIVERLSKGEPLAHICRDDHMPETRTVSDWRAARPTFFADFARAREDGFDAIAAECLDIADETGRDTKYVSRDGGVDAEVCNSEWISRSKLRVETRLKLLAKWDPKRYGDKITNEHVGPDNGPVQIVTDRDRAKAVASLLLKQRSTPE